MKTKSSSSLIGIIVFLFKGTLAYPANSGVGHGGDIFSHYLESSRFALVQALRTIGSQPATLCTTETNLSPEQQSDCRDFILQTSADVLNLHQIQPVPAFLLKATPLIVTGINGLPQEVDAMTVFGPTGDIEVNYNRVKYYSPFQLLTLIVHESSHKVLFNGFYVDDNTPIGHFSTGRQLLDSVGIGVATYAQEKSLIGRTFTLLDHFSCGVGINAGSSGAPTFSTSGFTSRLFIQTGSFDSYETGVGLSNTGLNVSVIESTQSEILFMASIHEDSGCREDKTAKRWTDISLIRVYKSLKGRPTPSDVTLFQQRVPGWNPVCDESASKPLSASYGTFQFSCVYDGSYANSLE